jgi:hypothetical protein
VINQPGGHHAVSFYASKYKTANGSEKNLSLSFEMTAPDLCHADQNARNLSGVRFKDLKLNHYHKISCFIASASV